MHRLSWHQKNDRYLFPAVHPAWEHKQEMGEPMDRNWRRSTPQKKYLQWHQVHIPYDFHDPCRRLMATRHHPLLIHGGRWKLFLLWLVSSQAWRLRPCVAIFPICRSQQLWWQDRQQRGVLHLQVSPQQLDSYLITFLQKMLEKPMDLHW